MADDTTPAPVAEPTVGPASPAPMQEKKKRAPRVPKAAAANAAAPVAAGTRRGGRKKTDTVADAKAAVVPEKANRRGKTAEASKPGRKNAKTWPAAEFAVQTASDEMADLLKLEEENKTLRKQLGDKLRAENVDLRKKLGVK